jgi:hypothetical protein
LKWWPRGQEILAHSSGPLVELIVYRVTISAGSPHRAAPSRSMYAGQSANVAWLFICPPLS